MPFAVRSLRSHTPQPPLPSCLQILESGMGPLLLQIQDSKFPGSPFSDLGVWTTYFLFRISEFTSWPQTSKAEWHQEVGKAQKFPSSPLLTCMDTSNPHGHNSRLCTRTSMDMPARSECSHLQWAHDLVSGSQNPGIPEPQSHWPEVGSALYQWCRYMWPAHLKTCNLAPRDQH